MTDFQTRKYPNIHEEFTCSICKKTKPRGVLQENGTIKWSFRDVREPEMCKVCIALEKQKRKVANNNSALTSNSENGERINREGGSKTKKQNGEKSRNTIYLSGLMQTTLEFLASTREMTQSQVIETLLDRYFRDELTSEERDTIFSLQALRKPKAL